MDDLDRHADQLVLADEKMIRDLVACRKAAGLTQGEVAVRMGVPLEGVQHIEGGWTDSRLTTLRRYAMAVGAVIEHRVKPFEAGEADE